MAKIRKTKRLKDFFRTYGLTPEQLDEYCRRAEDGFMDDEPLDDSSYNLPDDDE